MQKQHRHAIKLLKLYEVSWRWEDMEYALRRESSFQTVPRRLDSGFGRSIERLDLFSGGQSEWLPSRDIAPADWRSLPQSNVGERGFRSVKRGRNGLWSAISDLVEQVPIAHHVYRFPTPANYDHSGDVWDLRRIRRNDSADFSIVARNRVSSRLYERELQHGNS
jgi:hypothetical protein